MSRRNKHSPSKEGLSKNLQPSLFHVTYNSKTCMFSGQFFLMTVEGAPLCLASKKEWGKSERRGVGSETQSSPMGPCLFHRLNFMQCQSQNNLENQNANPKRRQEALISTHKLYGVRKLKKHRAEPTVGWVGGTTIHFLFEGLSFPSS